MIPEGIKGEVAEMRRTIESLEFEQARIGGILHEVLTPYLTTVEDCNEALELVPLGWNSFSIRRKLWELEQA